MSYIINNEPEIPLDSLLRHVATHLPELPYEVALDMVRERYKELARKSGAIRWYYELPIQKGVSEYFIDPPTGYEIYAVHSTGHPWTGRWHYWESPHHWNIWWGYRMRAVSNNHILFESPAVRDETDRYVLLTLIPSDCSDSIPAAVAGPWGRGIASGAVATALLMPSKAWSNPGLAQKHEIDFNRAVMGAKNLVLTERGTKSLEFKPLRIL